MISAYAECRFVKVHTELRVDFKILGPLEIAVGSGRLELGCTRQQIVVATLLLSAVPNAYKQNPRRRQQLPPIAVTSRWPLRIAGARLAARPHWKIQQLAERLADETRRLDELRHGDMGIRPSISLTYDSAGEQARRLFRRLALLDLPHCSGWLSAAFIDEPLARAEDLLDELVSAQLIQITGGGSGVYSQYRFHDLIRVFARERLAVEESAAERKAAHERALGALLYLADQAHCRYYGGDYVRIRSDAPRWPLPGRVVEQLVADPLAWYERERATLVSGVRQAVRAGFAELCWSLAFSAVALFAARVYLDDWQETHEIALEATRKAHNLRGQAAMLCSLGSLHMVQQRFESGPAGNWQRRPSCSGKQTTVRAWLMAHGTSREPREAVLFGQRAASTFRGMHAPLYEAQPLALLSDAHAALSDRDAAEADGGDVASEGAG